MNKDNQNTNQVEDKESPRQRGITLMQHALKALEEDDLEKFESSRKLANEYFDEMMKEENADEERMDGLYGENRNFGIAYQVIESNIKHLTETVEGQAVLRKIKQLFNEDVNLKKQLKAYNLFELKDHVNNVEAYINEAVKEVPTFDKAVLKESNEKLIRLLNENKINELVSISDEKIDMFESVEYLMLNNRNLDNIDEYMNACKVLREYVEKTQPEKKDTKSIEEIEEEIGADLNDDEVDFVEDMATKSDEEKEQTFNESKNALMTKLGRLIDEASDYETKSRIDNIRKKINEKVFDKNTVLVEVAEMREIFETLG